MSISSSAMTDKVENNILELYFRGQPITSASPFISLYTTTVKYYDYETGSPIEAQGGGYTRMSASGPTRLSSIKAIGESQTHIIQTLSVQDSVTALRYYYNWEVASGSARNRYEIDFPQATTSWGSIYGIGLATGQYPYTSGSELFYYSFPDKVYTPDSQYQYVIPSRGMVIFMSNIFTIYAANSILDWSLNAKELLPPKTSIQLRLYTTMPDVWGNNGVEVPKNSINGGTGYKPKYAGGTNYWGDAQNGSASALDALLTELSWTATDDWGVVTSFGFYDVYNEQLLIRYPLEFPREVLKGDTFSFGNITIMLH